MINIETANEKLFYKPSDVARMFGVDRVTVYIWINSGFLKAKKINGRFYVTGADIDIFIKKRGS